MHILVFNGGSSSLSYKIFDLHTTRKVKVVLQGKAHRVGVQGTRSSYIENHFKNKAEKEIVPIPDHTTATALASDYIKKYHIKVDAIGHRFVHGGEYFKRSALLDRTNLKKLERCVFLAPLHNPISLNVIHEAKRLFPHVPQYAVSDCAFHASIPPKAYTYPLPSKMIERYKYRRYGFHGISYSYICRCVPEFLRVAPKRMNMIICHLGTGGASVTAIKNGCSVDTSMGSSPNSGLIMSTRSGDIDPMVIFYLVQTCGYSPQKVEDLLNKKSGLLGVSGFSGDITDIIAHMRDRRFQKRAKLAFEMYVYRLKSYIGSYVAVLGGQIGALVFTDDIGVHNPLIRERVCASLQWAGFSLDKKKNRRAPKNKPAFIQSSSSKIPIIIMPTDEELMICLEGGRLLGGRK